MEQARPDAIHSILDLSALRVLSMEHPGEEVQEAIG